MEVIAELWQEVMYEISHESSKLLIELVQFALLVFLIKAVAFGIGKRSGMVTNMLSKRQERVAAQIEAANTQEASAADAPAQANLILVQGRRDSRRLLSEARTTAKSELERIEAEAASQVQELEHQAEETLAHEREEVLGGVRDVLLDVVARSTRQVLDEGYSAGQQREMIETAILESIEDLESVAIN